MEYDLYSPVIMKRQRLLYLNAVSRSVRAAVIGFAIHEPYASDSPQVEVGAEMPYGTVHEAILDGWVVVHFPDQRLDLEPERVGAFGYEFILSQMEALDE
ncbi:MAG: hypothetical protein FI699_06830 [SAR202 cluster bacterium]|nr:hypothetical protein [SAR202 cluster bacterium]